MRKRLLTYRRLVPLVLLASAIALAVAQLTKVVSYEVVIKFLLSDDLKVDLTGFKLQVTGPGQQEDRMATFVVFRVDPARPSYNEHPHVFNLIAGTYRLSFQFDQKNTGPTMVERFLEVTADATVNMRLP